MSSILISELDTIDIMTDEKANALPHAQIVYKFAKLVCDKKYTDAYSMLSPKLQSEYCPEKIESCYVNMIHYIPDDAPKEPSYIPPSDNQLIVESTLEDWVNKPENAIGWAYCSIYNIGFCEAVAVTVEKHGEKLLIGSIEWGRP